MQQLGLALLIHADFAFDHGHPRAFSSAVHREGGSFHRHQAIIRRHEQPARALLGGLHDHTAASQLNGSAAALARKRKLGALAHLEERAIRQALVPTQEAVEIKNGKKVNVERKIYPGYVLVEMVMDQETAHTVNGIQGVIKFVGHERLPQPLRPEEVNRLLGVADDSEPEEVKEEIPFLVGQAVAITEGPFTDFNGTVEEVLSDKGKVRVSVSLFGRPTSVELDYLQLKGY